MSAVKKPEFNLPQPSEQIPETARMSTILAQIATDAKVDPKRYVEQWVVPGGGE